MSVRSIVLAVANTRELCTVTANACVCWLPGLVDRQPWVLSASLSESPSLIYTIIAIVFSLITGGVGSTSKPLEYNVITTLSMISYA